MPISDGTHTVKELLNLEGTRTRSVHDPRTPRCYKLYYTKLFIQVADWEFEPKRKRMKLADEEDN